MSDFDDRDGVELPPKSAQSDDLRTRIAAVQASHHHWDYAGALTCACGEDFGVDNAGWEAAVTDWAQHVADAVIAELKLQPETLCNPGGAILTRLDGRVLADNRYMRRWATPWECAESPVK